MHKMCSDERKCAVMKGYLCSDELRRNKWRMEYLLLREHKARRRKTAWECVWKGGRGVTIGNRRLIMCRRRKGRRVENVKKAMTKKRSSEFWRDKMKN